MKWSNPVIHSVRHKSGLLRCLYWYPFETIVKNGLAAYYFLKRQSHRLKSNKNVWLNNFSDFVLDCFAACIPFNNGLVIASGTKQSGQIIPTIFVLSCFVACAPLTTGLSSQANKSNSAQKTPVITVLDSFVAVTLVSLRLFRHHRRIEEIQSHTSNDFFAIASPPTSLSVTIPSS